MRKTKKLWMISVAIMMVLFRFYPPITAKAADAEFRMMHGEQDALVVGVIQEVTEEGCLLDVEHVITCKAENTLNRTLPVEKIPEEMLIEEIRYVYSYHVKTEPEAGDSVVISVDKKGSKWQQVWLALEVSSVDIATLETAQPENMTNSEYAWQLFIRSDGEIVDFAYDGMDLYADGKLVFEHLKYHEALQEATNQEGSAKQTLMQENEDSVADDGETVILTNDGAVSISIIGGADGPTSIFLAGKLGTGFKVAVVVGIVLLAVTAIIIVKSIMKKKHKEK